MVGDAMRKEVYPALFRVDAGWVERLSPDTVAHPDSVAALWAALDEQVLVVGNGLNKYSELFDCPDLGLVLGESALWPPSGAGLLDAYAASIADGARGDGLAGALLPVYTRLSDAEENERDRAGVTAGLPSSGVDGPVDGGAR